MALQFSSASFVNFIYFGLLNNNHAKSANILLDRDILTRGLDVVFLNEPYYSKLGIVYFNKNYNIIFYPDKPRSGIIIANSAIKFTTLRVERDLIVLNLEFGNDNFIVINLYVPPSVNIEDYLVTVESLMIKYLRRKIIFVGDLIAKHALWGRQRSDSRGEVLLEFINKYDLTILNESSSPPTFDSVPGKSWIDLVLLATVFDVIIFLTGLKL